MLDLKDKEFFMLEYVLITLTPADNGKVSVDLDIESRDPNRAAVLASEALLAYLELHFDVEDCPSPKKRSKRLLHNRRRK